MSFAALSNVPSRIAGFFAALNPSKSGAARVSRAEKGGVSRSGHASREASAGPCTRATFAPSIVSRSRVDAVRNAKKAGGADSLYGALCQALQSREPDFELLNDLLDRLFDHLAAGWRPPQDWRQCATLLDAVGRLDDGSRITDESSRIFESNRATLQKLCDLWESSVGGFSKSSDPETNLKTVDSMISLSKAAVQLANVNLDKVDTTLMVALNDQSGLKKVKEEQAEYRDHSVRIKCLEKVRAKIVVDVARQKAERQRVDAIVTRRTELASMREKIAEAKVNAHDQPPGSKARSSMLAKIANMEQYAKGLKTEIAKLEMD